MSIGPINPGNFNGALKVAAAVTAAGAVSEKYADIGGTALGGIFQGDVWDTNLVIALSTGVAGTVVYSVEAAAAFEAAKLTSVLWLLSVGTKLKDANYDVSTLGDNKVETLIAAVSTYLAFA